MKVKLHHPKNQDGTNNTIKILEFKPESKEDIKTLEELHKLGKLSLHHSGTKWESNQISYLSYYTCQFDINRQKIHDLSQLHDEMAVLIDKMIKIINE